MCEMKNRNALQGSRSQVTYPSSIPCLGRFRAPPPSKVQDSVYFTASGFAGVQGPCDLQSISAKIQPIQYIILHPPPPIFPVYLSRPYTCFYGTLFEIPEASAQIVEIHESC